MKPYSRVILLILVLQAGVTGYLITMGLVSSLSENKFALLLVAELVLFAMMTYTYRTEKLNSIPNPAWIAVGVTIAVGFFGSCLIFAV